MCLPHIFEREAISHILLLQSVKLSLPKIEPACQGHAPRPSLGVSVYVAAVWCSFFEEGAVSKASAAPAQDLSWSPCKLQVTRRGSCHALQLLGMKHLCKERWFAITTHVQGLKLSDKL